MQLWKVRPIFVRLKLLPVSLLSAGWDKGTYIAIRADMDCFFGSYNLPEDNDFSKSGLVVFHIPELGIRFKAPFDGIDEYHTDFAALLALLEFIDSNQKFMKRAAYQIFCDNKSLVNQLNNIEPLPDKFMGLYQKARDYKEKYRFSLNWVKADKNSALDNLYD